MRKVQKNVIILVFMKLYPYLSTLLLLTLYYIIFRSVGVGSDDLPRLYDYEFKSFAVVGVILLIRLVRVDSWVGYFLFAAKIIHVLMAGLMFMFNVKFAIPFIIALLIVHFGFEPPFFDVGGKVDSLDERLVIPYIQSMEECYILFYTTWEDRCNAVAPVFSKIADLYTTNQRSFAMYNIGRSKEMQAAFNISATNGTLKQLPTIIHFKEGKEVKRLNPRIAGDQSLNIPTIVKHFKLILPKNE